MLEIIYAAEGTAVKWINKNNFFSSTMTKHKKQNLRYIFPHAHFGSNSFASMRPKINAFNFSICFDVINCRLTQENPNESEGVSNALFYSCTFGERKKPEESEENATTIEKKKS